MFRLLFFIASGGEELISDISRAYGAESCPSRHTSAPSYTAETVAARFRMRTKL